MDSYKCDKCKHSIIILLNGNIHTKIVGCLHEPYNGKWVVEIEECPNKNK